jgi:creatinine deaminase
MSLLKRRIEFVTFCGEESHRVTMMKTDKFLDAAIEEAEKGMAEGGIPIGAVLVHDGQIIGRGHNRRIQRDSAILHAEMDALENAGRQAARVYRESVLYTTLSPCVMCSGAILLYGIPKVVIGENQTFVGEEALLSSRGVNVDVLHNDVCTGLLQQFIAEHPQDWCEDIGEIEQSLPTAGQSANI